MARSAWRIAAHGAELRVRAQPGSSKDAVEGLGREVSGQLFLKVRVRAVREKGRANGAIEALLAERLGLPKSAVSVQKGKTGRIKAVRIAGAASIGSALYRALADLSGDPDGG